MVLSGYQTKMETNFTPIVDADRCRACRKCQAREVCRPKAIVRVDRDEPPFVDPRRCFGCRACVVACPFDALHMSGSS